MTKILPLVADIANGVFAVAFASYWFRVDIVWWHFLVGIALAFLPDIDAIPELLTRGKVSASSEYTKDHRTLLHFPVIALVVGFASIYFFGYWGVILAVAMWLHLVNDMYGTGWGLQLLWPFRMSHYKLLGRRANRLKYILKMNGDWDRLPVGEKRLRILVEWKQNEFKEYIKMWGIDEWIPLYYRKINWICAIEYSLFTVAIVFVLYALI